MSTWSEACSVQQYKLVPTYDMDEYFTDENKFQQLPWEDNMYAFLLLMFFDFLRLSLVLFDLIAFASISLGGLWSLYCFKVNF